jgi:XRE family transcriptional regulator, regulator of sulfur utilization
LSAVYPTHAQMGRAIRRLRLARRLSIEALAGDSQMHPTYLSAIERGHRNPTWAKLCGLAEALDIPVHSLVRVAEAEALGAAYTPGI